MELREQDRRKQQEEETYKREELVKILEENNRQMKREFERAAAKKLEKVNISLQCHLQRSTEEKEERERELIQMKQQIAFLMQLQRSRADPAQLERPQSRLSKKKLAEEERVKMAEKIRQERERVMQQKQQERRERKNQIPKRKKGKLPVDFTAPSEKTLLHKGKQIVAVGIDVPKVTISDAEADSTAETEKLLVDERVRKGYDEDPVQRPLRLEKVRATPQHIEESRKHRAEWRPMEDSKMAKARERRNHAHRTVVPCLAAIQLCG
ncbi:meiosis-specific nuclear structural protein 1-like [Gymnodraco acuticeps]|uniref:Meiosis-specific nuclear structural protein 1-like n=1 Tax=Gymnodraco acuticeps TaxID=8218 RepID=A0A6P8V873_GYMAC|nr:meiosis-specific nuclear structural protein 1-like [Gymnodraco acuticeps]